MDGRVKPGHDAERAVADAKEKPRREDRRNHPRCSRKSLSGRIFVKFIDRFPADAAGFFVGDRVADGCAVAGDDARLTGFDAAGEFGELVLRFTNGYD